MNRSRGRQAAFFAINRRGGRQAALLAALTLQQPPVAFVDVGVVTGAGSRQGQTVVVEGERIAWIGPSSEARLPAGTTRIPGRGLFLLPGFADMHTHPSSEADLLTYLVNGITTIRVMGGGETQVRWREAARTGGLMSPRIVTAGAIIDGNPPSQPSMRILTDPAAARAEVTAQHRAGVDVIKVYNSVPKAVYDSIVLVAGELGLPVAGHVPFEVGLGGALAARQATIEHLRGYVAELVPKDAPVQPGPSLRSRSVVWNYIDAARIPELAARTKAAGVWNCPTLVVATHNMLPTAEHAALLQRPGVKYLARSTVPDRSKISYLQDFTDADYRETQRGLVRQLEVVAGLHRAGARLLIGTDSWLQGFAFREELDLYRRAGIPAAEILAIATGGAAAFLGEAGRWGEVAVGQRADLQLVAGDPLRSWEALDSRRGVMLGGRWYPAAELIARLEAARQDAR
jgi:imidazolonepropionase-like amidohydrolase